MRCACRAGSAAKAPASKKAKLSSEHGLQTPGVGPPTSAPGTVPAYGRVVYTVDILTGKTIPLLQEICRNRGVPTSGRKGDLVQRILAAQSAPYPDQAAGP